MKVYVVIKPDGTVFRESARTDYNECRNSFVKGWIPKVGEHLGHHQCWTLWSAFEQERYKIEELEITSDRDDKSLELLKELFAHLKANQNGHSLSLELENELIARVEKYLLDK